jgi:hypothetical protein
MVVVIGFLYILVANFFVLFFLGVHFLVIKHTCACIHGQANLSSFDSDLEVSYLRDPVKIKVLYMFTVLNLCLKGSLKSRTGHNREHSFMSQNIVVSVPSLTLVAMKKHGLTAQ